MRPPRPAGLEVVVQVVKRRQVAPERLFQPFEEAAQRPVLPGFLAVVEQDGENRIYTQVTLFLHGKFTEAAAYIEQMGEEEQPSKAYMENGSPMGKVILLGDLKYIIALSPPSGNRAVEFPPLPFRPFPVPGWYG